MNALDELQLQFADDRSSAEEKLHQEREKVRANQRQAMIKSTTALVHTYHQTRAARAELEKKANGRKKGPSPTDRANMARLDATLTKLQTQIEGTEGYPYKALLHHDGEIMTTERGIPLHYGMTFTLMQSGQPVKGIIKGLNTKNRTVRVALEGDTGGSVVNLDVFDKAGDIQVSPEIAQKASAAAPTQGKPSLVDIASGPVRA